MSFGEEIAETSLYNETVIGYSKIWPLEEPMYREPKKKTEIPPLPHTHTHIELPNILREKRKRSFVPELCLSEILYDKKLKPSLQATSL